MPFGGFWPGKRRLAVRKLLDHPAATMQQSGVSVGAIATHAMCMVPNWTCMVHLQVLF
jgi:hypothetical protein